MNLHLVRAAAGTGKTTDLARRYLSFLASGVPVEQAIAITFTRRAAAELQERVTLALRASLTGPTALRAQERLGSAWSLYADVVPTDAARVREALAGLSDAPIGTTDGFIGLLLTEFALDAVLPIPRGSAEPIDIPIRAGAGMGSLMEGVARRVLDPPVGELNPDVRLLTRYFKLDTLLKDVSSRTSLDHLPVAGCDEVMGWLAQHIAEVLSEFDLRAVYNVPGDTVGDWVTALEGKTNVAGKWAVPRIGAWLAAGADRVAVPHVIAGWLRGLQNKGGQKQIRRALEATDVDFGITTLKLWRVIDSLRYPYEEPSHVILADSLRSARERLRAQVIGQGLRTAAATGGLGHDELAEAAIHLCQHPPPGLHGRFRALLVDEFQDANPTQIRLYRALAALPGPQPIETYFVGDSRQSIYSFRDAEPGAFQEIADQAGAERTVDLLVNYRSTPTLVSAHRTLFGALTEPMNEAGLTPLDDLSDLQHHPNNAAHELDPAHHPQPQPVWLVSGPPKERVTIKETNERALHAFLERVQRAWTHPNHAGDTAAVLAPNWHMARTACDFLRRWAGRDDIAHVEGGTSWTKNRVGTDLVFWLRALLDSADEIAWLAVWKHPSIGLSDAGIARARAGSGVFAIDAQTSEIIEAPAWMRSLGHLAEAECLDAPHSEADIAAFQHAAPLLRHARTQMDRSETSEILDVLATRLHWRTVLAAGPGGDDDLAQLEVALDWIRSLSGEGMSDEEIARVISDASHADPPQVPLSRTQRHIACTTVFQAKGRAWDHVCVTSPGRGARKDPTDDASTTWITLGTARRVRLVGLKFDPTGGLSPFKDPLGRLASAILRERFNEECARLAYVAVTRAKRTVTTGIPRPRDMYMPGQLQKLLATAWGRATLEDPGIARVIRDRPPQNDLAPTGWAREDPRGKLHHEDPMERRTWQERQPSSAGAHLSAEERQQRADRIANLVRLANGLHVGCAPIDPPEDAHGHLFARDWGQIAHGWFAMWRFRGSPTPADVAAWLQSEWGRSPEDVQSWLLSLSQSLPERSGALWTLVTDPASTLHFEYPLVGVGRGQDQDLLLSGRIDLLVERKRQLTVIDFKAGSRSPSGWADLVAQGGLKNYGPQLDAYRDTLENLGQSVESVALWFVRTGTTVRW